MRNLYKICCPAKIRTNFQLAGDFDRSSVWLSNNYDYYNVSRHFLFLKAK